MLQFDWPMGRSPSVWGSDDDENNIDKMNGTCVEF